MQHQPVLDFTARGMAAQMRSRARRLATLDTLARGIAENLPLGLPPVMAAPIAENRSATSQIGSGTTYGISSTNPANHFAHHFGLHGAGWAFGGSSTVFTNPTTHLGNGTDPSASIEYNRSGNVRFATFADKFEVFAQNQNGFRVLVNGKYAQSGLYGHYALNGDTLSSSRYWIFDLAGTDFAGVGYKLIEILPDIDFRFKGVRVPIGHTVVPCPQPFPLRCALHGDSMISSISDTGTDYRTAQHSQMPHVVQQLTGVADIWANNIGGAGFIADAGNTRSNFLEQLSIDFVGGKFDLIWELGGRNDYPLYGSESAYCETVKAWIAAVVGYNPEAIIVLTGPLSVQNGENYASSSAFSAIQRAKKSAAAQFPYNCAFIETVGNSTIGSDAWIFGTGKQGTPVGDGIADLVRGNDGTHLTVFGHQYVGSRLVTETAKVLPHLYSRIRDGFIAGVNDADIA